MDQVSSTLPIQRSTDYSQFQRIGGNRIVSKSHIDRLRTALENDPDCTKYNPILVNENMEIIDGQHRFEAIQELKLPVYYIKAHGLGLKNVQNLNSVSKVWGPVDFAKSFAELGNENYKVYLDFRKRYHFSHEVLLKALVMSRTVMADSFRHGKLVVEDETLSHDFCIKLSEIGTFLPKRQHKLRAFAFAFMTMWQNEKYDHDRMMLKMSQRSRTIEHRALTEDYARDLEAIYNFGVTIDSRVRFF